jgi:hypothetical protein
MQTTVGPAAISVPSPLIWDGRVLPYSWARPLAFRTMDSLRLRFGLSIRDPTYSRLMSAVFAHASTVPREPRVPHASTVPRCGFGLAHASTVPRRRCVRYASIVPYRVARARCWLRLTRREIEGIFRYLRRSGAKAPLAGVHSDSIRYTSDERRARSRQRRRTTSVVGPSFGTQRVPCQPSGIFGSVNS